MIFEYRDYKLYVNSWIEAQPRGGHGLQKKIADAIQCKTPYVSRVLKGDAHFNSEQAIALSNFMGHLQLESHYFMLMVQFGRAGTSILQTFYEKQMMELAASQTNLAQRLRSEFQLQGEHLQRYFSNWTYSAIHMLLTIPGFQTTDAIVERTRLSREVVLEILRFFTECGLLEAYEGKYQPGLATMHLPRDSPLVGQHHTNFRIAAIQNISFGNKNDDLHYSSVVTLSRSDFGRIRTKLVDDLTSISKMIDASPAEVLVTFNLDLFETMRP